MVTSLWEAILRTRIVATTIGVVVALGLTGITAMADQEPLQILAWSEFDEFTGKEKDLYLTGLLEGQSFVLFGAYHPDLAAFVICVEGVGVTRIRETTETLLVLHPEELELPVPWAVSRAIGTLCDAYRR